MSDDELDNEMSELIYNQTSFVYKLCLYIAEKEIKKIIIEKEFSDNIFKLKEGTENVN